MVNGSPFDAAAERVILEDFQRLWKSGADLSVEVQDYLFSNGVVGKLVAYHITNGSCRVGRV